MPGVSPGDLYKYVEEVGISSLFKASLGFWYLSVSESSHFRARYIKHGVDLDATNMLYNGGNAYQWYLFLKDQSKNNKSVVKNKRNL